MRYLEKSIILHKKNNLTQHIKHIHRSKIACFGRLKSEYRKNSEYAQFNTIIR